MQAVKGPSKFSSRPISYNCSYCQTRDKYISDQQTQNSNIDAYSYGDFPTRVLPDRDVREHGNKSNCNVKVLDRKDTSPAVQKFLKDCYPELIQHEKRSSNRHSITTQQKAAFSCPIEGCTYSNDQKGNVKQHVQKKHQIKDFTKEDVPSPNKKVHLRFSQTGVKKFKNRQKKYESLLYDAKTADSIFQGMSNNDSKSLAPHIMDLHTKLGQLPLIKNASKGYSGYSPIERTLGLAESRQKLERHAEKRPSYDVKMKSLGSLGKNSLKDINLSDFI